MTGFGNDLGLDLGNHHALGCCSAGAGYDLASGIGSVNVAALAAAATIRQPPLVTLALALPRGQRPLRQRAVRAIVSCSARCVAGAFASVSIGRARPFEIDSRVVHLRSAGQAKLSLRLTPRQLARVRSAVRAHTRVSATVRGVLLDPATFGVLADSGSSVHKETPGKQLTIRS